MVLGQAYCLLPIPHAVVYVRLRCVMDPVMAALAHGFGGHMVASLCCTSPPTPGDMFIIAHPESFVNVTFVTPETQHPPLRTCYKHYNHVTTHHAATTRRMLGGVHSTYSKRFPLEQLQERQQGMMLSIVLLPPL